MSMSMSEIAAAAAKPILNEAGKFVTQTVEDWLKRHPNDFVVTIGKIELLVREQVLDNWGHNIKLTIIASPDDKLDGITTSNTGSSTKKAREKGLQALVTK